jgi:transposase-like protein
MTTSLEQSYYPLDERERAVALYLIHGNSHKVSELTGIPQRTLNDWIRRAEWWADSLARIRHEHQAEIDAGLTRIISDAIAQQLDRLEHGDEVILDKDTVMRRKLSGKDCAVMAAIAFDKRQILRHEPTSIRTAESRSVRLARLAQNMREALQGRVIEPNDPKEP